MSERETDRQTETETEADRQTETETQREAYQAPGAISYMSHPLAHQNGHIKTAGAIP